MTEDKIQRLRDAGISEEVIIDMMKKPNEPRSEGYIDPTTPSSTFTQAQATGAPTQGPEASMTQLGAEAATLVPEALKYGGLAAGGYGLYKYGKGLANRVMNPPYTPPPGGSFNTPGPVKPTGAPVSAAPQPMGQPLQDFVQQRGAYAPPQQPAPAPAQTSLTERVKQMAAQRIVPVAQSMAPYLRAASGVGAMLYPSSLNTGEAEQLAEYRRRTGQQP